MGLAVQFCLIAVLCITMYRAEDLIIGSNGIVAYSKYVNISSSRYFPRTKYVFYHTKDAEKIIKGISAIDIDKTKARATVTSGGIGSTYVNVKLKSERGEGLNYLVQILV